MLTPPKGPPRTLLVVASSFAPFGGASSRRVTMLVKHLAPLGWRSVIVTPSRVLRNPSDASLAHQVPVDTVVVRTATLEPVRARGDHGRALLALRRALNVPLVPSVTALWAPFALEAALRALRRHRVERILASGPDFTSFVVGAALKSITGLPLLLDYRDEWTTHPERRLHIEGRPLRQLKSGLDRRLEQWCLTIADRVILNTGSFRATLVDEIGCAPAKLLALGNGYDPALVRPRSPHSDNEIRIVHLGQVDRASQLDDAFFAALRGAAARHARPIRLRFVGQVLPELVAMLDRQQGGGLVIERTGFLPIEEALATLVDADAGLILQEREPGKERYQNLKLFDYLGARCPILAVAPDPGEIASLVRGHRAGWVLAPADAGRVGDVVDALLAGRASELTFEGVESHAWPRITERLAAILEAPLARTGSAER